MPSPAGATGPPPRSDEREIGLLQEEIARLEGEDEEKVERLSELAVDLVDAREAREASNVADPEILNSREAGAEVKANLHSIVKSLTI